MERRPDKLASEQFHVFLHGLLNCLLTTQVVQGRLC